LLLLYPVVAFSYFNINIRKKNLFLNEHRMCRWILKTSAFDFKKLINNNWKHKKKFTIKKIRFRCSNWRGTWGGTFRKVWKKNFHLDSQIIKILYDKPPTPQTRFFALIFSYWYTYTYIIIIHLLTSLEV
jgi:hypothetical protein